jgi:hypothetical protein
VNIASVPEPLAHMTSTCSSTRQGDPSSVRGDTSVGSNASTASQGMNALLCGPLNLAPHEDNRVSDVFSVAGRGGECGVIDVGEGFVVFLCSVD